MSALPAVRNNNAESIERVVLQGDLSKLTAEERVGYHKMVCESIGLNPLTKPFEYITLNGKLTLYAKKDATDQLRSINQVSITIPAREVTEGVYVVTARATLPSGRTDESIGAVPIENLKGEARANACMKAETKAKRRVTLSICGLGILDESELESIPTARPPSAVPRTTEEIKIDGPATSAAANRQPTVKGEAGPEKAVEMEPEKPQAESGSDLTIANEPGMVVNFARSFKEALPKNLQKNDDALRHEWLGLNFYFDADNKPTSKAILKAEFEKVKAEACKWAAAKR